MSAMLSFLCVVVATVGLLLLAGWLMHDAQERGKSGLLVVLLVLVLNIPGLLIWLTCRPEKKPREAVESSDEIDPD